MFFKNLIFCSEGELIYVTTNCPGSWHDSRIAESLYKRLFEKTPTGYFLIADTAFPHSDARLRGKIKVPLKSGAQVSADPRERENVLEENRELVNARQAAEWGMRAIQGTFGRLRGKLPISRAAERRQILECCFRLHQVRVRRVGEDEDEIRE